MQAESGRLIVGVKLSDEIRNTFLVTLYMLEHQVTYADGTSKCVWSMVMIISDDYTHKMTY